VLACGWLLNGSFGPLTDLTATPRSSRGAGLYTPYGFCSTGQPSSGGHAVRTRLACVCSVLTVLIGCIGCCLVDVVCLAVTTQ